MNRQQLSARLINAAATRTATTPLTDEYPDLDVATAYEIQDEVIAARTSAGAVVVGAKLGLTSAAKQQQMNVSEPLYGILTDDMLIDTGANLVCDRFIQPRCEPEVAFLMAEDLQGSGVSAARVLAATALVFPAIDVLDSRFAGYSFTLPDVVADNSSCAGFILGGQGVDPRGFDLRTVGCVFEKNGKLVATAAGAAVMGHPAASVAWLVRKLASRGQGLSAGQVVLSGSMTEAIAVAPGDTVSARIDRLGTVEVGCI
ncbi:MAG: 2-keto-4-pentenoate hydratase [Actinomycetes bacterium]|jgi:2-oxo-3-hexenedioate decarboxylase|nr:fumarylacetoacetate hydrolase family protein [Candidatus Nanopelagicales bacterium]MDP4824787.1 fumarylacetoacetate hydrolase family protein [Candidatus Nanopelagicales bacterium]MDP4888628.1 fumarylacetoacetate hydrolase family protein [Candidatus Nanopelagicales bacterium]